MLENMILGSGISLTKLWFSVTQKEQRTRFAIRQVDPVRQWKLSPTDLASLDKWDDYTKAKEAMFEHTDTEWAPWTVIKSNDKKRARVEVMRYVLVSLDYPGKNTDFIHAPDPLIVGPAKHILDEGEGGFQEGYPDRHDGGKTPTHTAPKSKSAAKARAKAQAEVKALEVQRAAESIARGDGDKSAEQKSAEAKAAELGISLSDRDTGASSNPPRRIAGECLDAAAKGPLDAAIVERLRAAFRAAPESSTWTGQT